MYCCKRHRRPCRVPARAPMPRGIATLGRHGLFCRRAPHDGGGGQRGGFEHEREQLELLAGIEITAETIGADIEAREQTEIRRAKQLELPGICGRCRPRLLHWTGRYGCAGSRGPRRRGRVGKIEGQAARAREVKLGCVFTQTTADPDGGPVRDVGEAWRRGWSRAQKRVMISDGAAWIRHVLGRLRRQPYYRLALFPSQPPFRRLLGRAFPSRLISYVPAREVGRTAAATGRRGNQYEPKPESTPSVPGYHISNTYRQISNQYCLSARCNAGHFPKGTRISEASTPCRARRARRQGYEIEIAVLVRFRRRQQTSIPVEAVDPIIMGPDQLDQFNDVTALGPQTSVLRLKQNDRA